MEILLSFFPVVIIILLVAIVAVLFTGVLAMGIGGRIAPDIRNKLMKTRLVLQGIILFLVVIYVAAQSFR